jgi:hypothetical protein
LKMQAFEFKTKFRNGIIKIPEKTGLPPNQEVKVIVLLDDVIEQVELEKSSRDFLATRIKTKGFRFNREEVHER